ncbi:hypothetical protein [Actinomadura flavalba]|uniref:hypothetical protein n=1 Tax=Actinomadura flavalba TaxID=1120938 RepID=UPI0012DBD3FF|nr:hypothetical protein [Actinomadura flavalba]
MGDEAAFNVATFVREDFVGRASSVDPGAERPVSGFLMLSMLAAFHKRELRLPPGRHALNYGLDRVRFLRTVMTGEQVRLDAELLDAVEKSSGLRVLTRNRLYVEGFDDPAMIADWIMLISPPPR